MSRDNEILHGGYFSIIRMNNRLHVDVTSFKTVYLTESLDENIVNHFIHTLQQFRTKKKVFLKYFTRSNNQFDFI